MMLAITRTGSKLFGPGMVMVIALVAAACGSPSPPVRYYTFSVLPYPAQAPPERGRPVAVAPAQVPAYLDRPHIVTREGLNTVVMAEYDRWASPLQEGLAWAVAQNLSALLKSDQVTAGIEGAGLGSVYHVTISVHRFEGWPRERFNLVATWSIEAPEGERQPSKGRTVIEEPISEAGVEGLVAAASRAVITLSRDIAAAIEQP